MMDVLIFSMNRACQLEMLLRTLRDNVTGINNIYVLWRSTNDDFYAAYQDDRLHEIDMPLTFYPQIQDKIIFKNNVVENTFEFRDTFRMITNIISTKHMLMMCDDMIIIDKVDLNVVGEITDKRHINSTVLFLHRKNNLCYAKNVPQEVPPLTELGKGLYSWKWQHCNYDWGYANQIGAAIYKTDKMRFWVRFLQPLFKTPNYFESAMNYGYKCQVKEMTDPINVCFADSQKAVGLQINQVQTDKQNRHGNKPQYSVEALNKKFMEGWSLDPTPFYGQTYNACIIEPDFMMWFDGTNFNPMK